MRAQRDDVTGSTWSVTGVAVDGPMAGARLQPVTYTNAFWFGWREFRPDTRVSAADARRQKGFGTLARNLLQEPAQGAGV